MLITQKRYELICTCKSLLKNQFVSLNDICFHSLLKDDVMHVILRVQVPVLHVKANYALVGKVGSQIVRGNGLFSGNFSKDFLSIN